MTNSDSVPSVPPFGPETPPSVDSARPPPFSPLLERIRQGDRQAAAEFIARSAPRIRRRFRGKIARSLRTHFDSDDLLATISRRLDDIVRQQKLTAASEAQLWSLLSHLANNAVSEHARRDLRGTRAATPDTDQPAPPPQAPPDIELKPDSPMLKSILELCLAALSTETDLRTLRMRLDRRTHAQVAASEGVSVDAARKRWQRVRNTVGTVLGLVGVQDPAPRRAKSPTKTPENLASIPNTQPAAQETPEADRPAPPPDTHLSVAAAQPTDPSAPGDTPSHALPRNDD